MTSSGHHVIYSNLAFGCRSTSTRYAQQIKLLRSNTTIVLAKDVFSSEGAWPPSGVCYNSRAIVTLSLRCGDVIHVVANPADSVMRNNSYLNVQRIA